MHVLLCVCVCGAVWGLTYGNATNSCFLKGLTKQDLILLLSDMMLIIMIMCVRTNNRFKSREGETKHSLLDYWQLNVTDDGCTEIYHTQIMFPL